LLEDLVRQGKIRYYAWSTDDPGRVRAFADGAQHNASVQHNQNLIEDNAAMIALCEELNLASVNRGPLAMGLLTGKFNSQSTIDADDTRHDWDFTQGKIADHLKTLEAVRDILTQGGRTLAQGALGWLWARSEKTIPIPGFKSVKQVEDNAGTLAHGPLTADQMQQINSLLSRSA
jgi:aryl-alcohol dehydrogenase-like predicted oxidoreductase